MPQFPHRSRVAVPRVIACRRYRMISHMTEFPKKKEKKKAYKAILKKRLPKIKNKLPAAKKKTQQPIFFLLRRKVLRAQNRVLPCARNQPRGGCCRGYVDPNVAPVQQQRKTNY